MWSVMLGTACYGIHDNEGAARANFEMRLAPRPKNSYSFTLVHPNGKREVADSTIAGGGKK